MFFLDVSPEEAYRRIKRERKRLEMFENLEELRVVRRRALCLALVGKWTIIDANELVEDVEKVVKRHCS
ncbi:hypothetical protein GWO13_03435 [Candidatus Bathyarchaeota archaeon]|nr:hypothetical protein [Candidatus Bathyarchaeota archaeon]